MNSAQREAIFERDGRACVICWEDNPRLLTVDHIKGRRVVKGEKVDEGWENLWTLCKDCHWQKDNAGSESQSRYIVYPVIARAAGSLDVARYDHLREVALVLSMGNSFEDIGFQYAMAFKGKEPSQYAEAYKKEVEDYKLRKAKKSKARSAIRQKLKTKLKPKKPSKWEKFPIKPA